MSSIIQRIISRVSSLKPELEYQLALAKHAPNLPKLDPTDQDIVETCRRDGVCVTSLEALGFKTSSALLQATNEYLDIMRQLRPSRAASDQTPAMPQIFMVSDLADFTQWGKEPRLLNIIENYIGLPIEFQGVHLRRDFANTAAVGTELWHKDWEDRRILKAIVYLTDVGEEDGPFEYIPKSALSPLQNLRIRYEISKARAVGIPDALLQTIAPSNTWKSCLGPAGTVVLVDTAQVFHHGRTRKTERSALFYVYTAGPPLRPELCLQYHDDTFARPAMLSAETLFADQQPVQCVSLEKANGQD